VAALLEELLARLLDMKKSVRARVVENAQFLLQSEVVTMRKIGTLGLLMALGLFVLTGCTTAQKYAAGGGLIGGAIGAAVGHHEVAEGIVIGAATGGLLGALVGDYKEVRDLKAEMEKLNNRIKDLESQLKAKDDEIARLQKEIEDLKARQICEKIELSNDVLFSPGKNVLTAKGKDVLKNVVAHISSAYPGKTIVVEGHTDSDPIKRSHWKSNWELGSGRALSVLHYLVDDGKIDPALISAQTFSKYHPVADNSTKAGKAQNRRSVITILSGPMKSTPETAK